MSAVESKGAIWASFAANIGIAISKFVAFLLTGASSMLAEAVHSVVDSSNQVLLLIGGRQSRQKPSKTHPFGYGRAHFLYAFIVSIVLFSLGGVFAVYEGIEKINHPHALESPYIAYIVLAVATALEGFALRTVLREAKSFKPKDQSWWQFLRQTKSVNHVVLTLEDSAALLGLLFATIGITVALLTRNPVWDGISTLMIGVLLIGVAFILFREVKSLLIGEAVDEITERKMRDLILSVDGVDLVVDLKTLYVGPMELFVAMKVTVDEEDSARVVSDTINEVEARLRQAFPIARLIYVEPDVYRTKQQQRAADKAIARSIKR
jgi:cation diffusion facilitator family transporter